MAPLRQVGCRSGGGMTPIGTPSEYNGARTRRPHVQETDDDETRSGRRAPPDLPVLWVVTPGGLETEGLPFGEVARLLSQ